MKPPLYELNFSKNFSVFFNCINELTLETESRNIINILFEYGLFKFSKFFLSLLNESLYFISIRSSPEGSLEKSTIISGSEKFFKYQSFIGRTAANFPRLFYGNRREAKNIIRLTKYFKENGYITNYCSHQCKKDNARTLHNATISELYDHQMLLCDPNAARYYKPYRKCLYGKDDVGFLFDYSEQFWRKYKNNRKLSLIVLVVLMKKQVKSLNI